MMNAQHPFLEDLNWRYATKKFDSSKKINEADFQVLMEAIRLTASSYGLQPFKVFNIENPEIREQIRPLAWNQSQITDASHLILFANEINFGAANIDRYLELVCEIRNLDPENVKGYGDFMKSKISELTEEEKNIWTSKQTYIALGNVLTAAARLRIDTCPLEGFDREKVNALLQLPEQGYSASVMVALGYRSQEDANQHMPKVRKPKEELFIQL